MKSSGVGLIGVLFLATLPLCAQAPDAGSGSANAAKPATVPPAAQTDASATSTEKKKPKKVWTNDEIGSVKGSVSVVGDEKRNKSNPNAAPPTAQDRDASKGDHQQQAENYRNQIAGLRSQIDAIDQRIAQLKSFKGENTTPTGGININQGYNMVPVEDQVKQLEERKKKLQANIEDVENDARKNGIDPGELR